MSRIIFAAAFLLGSAAIIWIGTGFVGSHGVALAITALIAAVYCLGFIEMLQFRYATLTLVRSLAAIPNTLFNLDEWLNKIHPSLQNNVRLRIEGERIGLPGPSLTPYLVGLLVMLGMLGTFLGMVVTLNGAAFSLEGTSDLQAIRSGLAAPIKGLGLAFGTSVAGVAASAMLGLISTLCRRERMQAAQFLDTKISTALRGFSLSHNRQETYKALQFQAQALPNVVDKLEAMAAQMERMSNHLSESLVTNQTNFHASVKGVYVELANSVEKSLKESLAESGKLAGESIKPIVLDAMTSIAREAQNTHETLIKITQTQLDGFSERFSHTAQTVEDSWKEAVVNQEHSNEKISISLQTLFNQASSTLLANQAASEQQRLAQWAASMESLASALKHEWQQSAEQAFSQQQKMCDALEITARGITENAHVSSNQMLNEMARIFSASEELVKTQINSSDDLIRSRIESEEAWLTKQGERMDQLANTLRNELNALREEEATYGKLAVEQLAGLQRAATEVIGQLRQQISNNIEQDNNLLEERSRIMQQLDALLKLLNYTTAEQRSAIEALVNTSADMLKGVSNQFNEQVMAEASKLSAEAAHVTGSAIEVSSLSEAFGFAVQRFSDSNEKLIDSLNRIETSLDKSTARSDEQLAYYVAQAREIIDLSMLSQHEIFEEMRQLTTKKERGTVKESLTVDDQEAAEVI